MSGRSDTEDRLLKPPGKLTAAPHFRPSLAVDDLERALAFYWSPRERGAVFQEQVRPRLHDRAGEQGQEDDRLHPQDPQRGTRHRDCVTSA